MHQDGDSMLFVGYHKLLVMLMKIDGEVQGVLCYYRKAGENLRM